MPPRRIGTSPRHRPSSGSLSGVGVLLGGVVVAYGSTELRVPYGPCLLVDRAVPGRDVDDEGVLEVGGLLQMVEEAEDSALLSHGDQPEPQGLPQRGERSPRRRPRSLAAGQERDQQGHRVVGGVLRCWLFDLDRAVVGRRLLVHEHGHAAHRELGLRLPDDAVVGGPAQRSWRSSTLDLEVARQEWAKVRDTSSSRVDHAVAAAVAAVDESSRSVGDVGVVDLDTSPSLLRADNLGGESQGGVVVGCVGPDKAEDVIERELLLLSSCWAASPSAVRRSAGRARSA